MLDKYSFNFSILLPFFMRWINETLKLEWCKTSRMLIVGIINLRKGKFIPCIFYINTLKLYTQKHHKYIKYSICHDFIKIYSVVTSNFLFMLERCFSIAPTSFPKYIHNIKTHIECFSCWSWSATMWSNVFYQISLCKCFLDPSPKSVSWCCMIWFLISINNLFCSLPTLSTQR